MAESTEAITDAYTTLTDPHRRYVLYYLTEQADPVALDSLAIQVAAWREDSDPDAVDAATVAEIRTALHHIHLPRLADLGVITYQDNPGEIALTDEMGSLKPFLEPARRTDLVTDVANGQS